MPKTPFADRFRRARRDARDPDRGGRLSQERFAELVSQRSTRAGFPTSGTVSNWECGHAQPSRHDRETLCAIVELLLEQGGLKSRSDANTFLVSGGYAPLAQGEARQFEEAQTEITAPDRPRGVQIVASSTEPMHEILTKQADTRSDAEEARPICAVEMESAKPVPTAILIVVRHQSMEPIPEKAVLASLPEAYRKHRVIELVIEQCDLFQGNRLSDPCEAARRQFDLASSLTELLVRYPEAQVAYYGIAHVPLHFLAGFQLSNRRRIELFDFDKHRRTWDQLQHHGAEPQLIRSGLPARVRRTPGAVVVRISINHRVTPEVVAEVMPTAIASIHLTLKQPQVDVVTSEEQVWEYGRVFRQTMDEIHDLLPGASGIHVFYAGPPSVAFYCGQQISKTIHPQIVIYNYVGKDVPRYSWALDLTREITATGFMVRPGNTLGSSGSTS